MTPRCEQISLDDLIDYAAGELPESEAAALEEHLFSCAGCAARAADLDTLVLALRPALRSAEVGGFVTDAVLNRLARSARSGIERWRACATACWDKERRQGVPVDRKRGHERPWMRADRARRSD